MSYPRREVMEAEIRDLEQRLRELRAANRDTAGISFGKRVGDGTAIAVERITQVAAYEQMQGKLAEVRAALRKIDEGTYAVCEVCGKTIAPARLEAIPSATMCVECAGKRTARR
jgi:DnaK suppressor protein